jgi:GrpB-like predicted nucleotidyltransferase (UPF0157 family)
MEKHAIAMGSASAHQTAQERNVGMMGVAGLVAHALMEKHAIAMGSACAHQNAKASSAGTTGAEGCVAHALMDMHAIPMGSVFTAHQTARPSSAGTMGAAGFAVIVSMDMHATKMGNVSRYVFQIAKQNRNYAVLTDVEGNAHQGATLDLSAGMILGVILSLVFQTAPERNAGTMDAAIQTLVGNVAQPCHAQRMEGAWKVRAGASLQARQNAWTPSQSGYVSSKTDSRCS